MGAEFKRIFEELWLTTRILAGEGILDGFGHVSARDPRHEEHYYRFVLDCPWKFLVKKWCDVE